MKLLVTGGCGFIGSNFVRYYFAKHPEDEIVNLDLLTYAGNPENLKDIEKNPHYHFVHGDIADGKVVDEIMKDGIDVVVHFAAESHVDRSINYPLVFIQTNVIGTQVLLQSALSYNIKRFVQVSTDEVYGTLGETGAFTETTPLAPRSPYSASKASADLLCLAYVETYGLDAVITRCCNNYGPYQFPEKLIPLMIINALTGKKLPVYGDGMNVRDWIHVLDHCSALDIVLRKGNKGEVYNIGSRNEWRNIDLVKKILNILDLSYDLIMFVKDRPGHDRRYAIDGTKLMNELGWKPETDFEHGLADTVKWYQNNAEWWKKIISVEYHE